MKRLGFLLAACVACATSEAPTPKVVNSAAECPQKWTKADGADVATVLGKRVAKVCTLGGDAQLAAMVARSEDAPLDPTWVSERLQALFKSGRVRDAEVIATPLDEQRVVLTFFVTPYEHITKVRIEPAPALELDAFATITPDAYAIASPLGLRALSAAVRQIYVDRGYPSATAKAVMVQDEAVITVTQGARDDIKSIHFSGLKRLTEVQLRSLMKSREGEAYLADTVLRDQLYIQALYLDHGMLRIAVTPTYQNGELLIRVDEGAVFKVSAVTFAGAPLRNTNALLEAFEIKRGKAFSRTAAIHDIELIRQRAADQGLQVSVLPATNVDDKKKTVALTYELEPHPDATLDDARR